MKAATLVVSEFLVGRARFIASPRVRRLDAAAERRAFAPLLGAVRLAGSVRRLFGSLFGRRRADRDIE